MKYVIPILLIIFLNPTFAQDSQTFKDFSKLLDDHSLKFEMPGDFRETDIRSNSDQYYNYAIKSNEQKLEIRYALFSIKNMIEENKKSGGLSANPNNMFKLMVSTIQLNLSPGQEYKVIRFAPEAVKEEFLADDGGTSFFPVDSEFGEGYKKLRTCVST